MPQPVDQFLGIRRIQDVVQSVGLAWFFHTCGHGQQMQVVVAQDRNRLVAERDDRAQGIERTGAPIDEVAGEPELRIGVVGDLGVSEQFVQRLATTLYVSDHPYAAL
jgi:hypothetical protein